jgi:hypothetical protein
MNSAFFEVLLVINKTGNYVWSKVTNTDSCLSVDTGMPTAFRTASVDRNITYVRWLHVALESKLSVLLTAIYYYTRIGR